jgi:hypothetical protein
MSEEAYTPDPEELEMARDFIRACSVKDLLDCWERSCKEWDSSSIISLHRFICDAERVQELIEAVKEKVTGD